MRYWPLLFLLLLPTLSFALVSEGRPGVPYYNHVLFLAKKQVIDQGVGWVSLAYGDPGDETLDCRNTIDVFNGRELFRDIPEGSWVLVDYELQSILIEEGFFGDADVFNVVACKDVESCCELRDRLNADPSEQAKRKRRSRPAKTKPAAIGEIGRELAIGRQLTKAARCRGCHSIEGFGAQHAPGLTWKRYKYEPGWLENYLRAPYRMRPALTNLMMLKFTSPNAVPNLKEQEVTALAGYLARVGWTKSPADRFRNEPWADYDCFECHTRLYKEQPLAFEPTPVPAPLGREVSAIGSMDLCLACHGFGAYRQVPVPAGDPPAYAFAPDLLLAMEKLEAKYFINYLRDPGYLQPGSRMPKLALSEQQLEELKELVLTIKEAIAAGQLKPVHNYYLMEKRSSETPKP